MEKICEILSSSVFPFQRFRIQIPYLKGNFKNAPSDSCGIFRVTKDIVERTSAFDRPSGRAGGPSS